MLCIILATNYIFIAGRSFHSETASYDVISRNHSSWPSLNSYRLGKLYINIPIIYKLARTICYYCCGKFKCILILGRRRGLGVVVATQFPPSPWAFFWVFFFSQRVKHQHLMFSVHVRLSFARIFSQVQWYDVISRRWSSHCFLFHLFSTKK